MKHKHSASSGFRPGFPVKFIFIALALLVALAGVVWAEDNKKVRSFHFEHFPAKAGQEHLYSGKVAWFGPLDREGLLDFRVRWAVVSVNKWRECAGFRGYKKENTKRRGNAFVTAVQPDIVTTKWGKFYYTTQGWDSFTMPGVKVKWGETLHIQVRARYKGKRHGPWVGMKLMNEGYLDDPEGSAWRRNNLPESHPGRTGGWRGLNSRPCGEW